MKKKSIKRKYLIMLGIGVSSIWCASSYATQPIAGSGIVNATGQTEGVAMTGATVDTLSVNAAFPDVFTNNRLVDGVSAIDPTIVAIATDTANDDTIVFNTSSTIYGTIGTAGNFFRKVDVNDGFTVNFLGTVFTTSTAGSFDIGGGSVANFNSGTGTNQAAITFTGDGTANLSANTIITGAVITNTDNTGTLSLASGSKIVGAVTGLKSINVVGGSDAAGVVGTINGATTGIHKTSLLTNELNITGGILTFATNGVIDTTVASSTVYGHILVQGGFASNLGTGLAVNVLVSPTADLTPGTLFYIVRSTSGTGALATVTTVNPTNPLYTFEVDTTASVGDATIRLLTVPLQIPIVNPPASPLLPVVIPVATALLNTPETPDITIIRAAINSLSNANDVVNAEAQLAPLSPALAAPLLTFQQSRLFQNLWLSRLDMCSQDNNPRLLNSELDCPEVESHDGWWMKGIGYSGHRGDNEAYHGFDSRILGVMTAYDVSLGDDARGGIGFGYARTDIDGDTFDTETNFDSYRAMVYYGYEPGPWFVNSGLSFGWNDYSGERNISLPSLNRRATAEYSGQDYTAFIESGYHLVFGKFMVTPNASLQYSRVNISSYTENDAGDIDLVVDSQGYDFIESGLGIKIARAFNYNSKSLVPEIHFKWLHAVSNPTLEQNARFDVAGSTKFTTHGLHVSDDTYNAGVGLTLLSCNCDEDTWSVEATYDYEWRSDNYYANQASLRLTKYF